MFVATKFSTAFSKQFSYFNLNIFNNCNELLMAATMLNCWIIKKKIEKIVCIITKLLLCFCCLWCNLVSCWYIREIEKILLQSFASYFAFVFSFLFFSIYMLSMIIQFRIYFAPFIQLPQLLHYMTQFAQWGKRNKEFLISWHFLLRLEVYLVCCYCHNWLLCSTDEWNSMLLH